MESTEEKKFVLAAEDNDDHFSLMQEAFAAAALPYAFRRVKNGEELLDYLRHRNSFHDVAGLPPPDLILLDLNMPRMDGRQALSEIKADSNLRNIPILDFTTSKNEEDRHFAERLEATAFVLKPARFDELVQFMKMLPSYIHSLSKPF
jgi:CheY-like chemotaxis protein